MYVNNLFFDDENNKRLAFGMAGAVVLHAFILIWLSLPQSQKTISSDVFNVPTSVSIRFSTPSPEPVKPVIKKVAKAAVQKPIPQELNKIEPAATPSQTFEKVQQPVQQEVAEVPTPMRDVIPVVSETNLVGRRVQPQYPKRSLRMGQEGVVWIHVLIDEGGKRQQVKLHKPSQFALLNQAAIKAVKKWTFDPNILNGRAVKSWVEIPIEFRIQ